MHCAPLEHKQLGKHGSTARKIIMLLICTATALSGHEQKVTPGSPNSRQAEIIRLCVWIDIMMPNPAISVTIEVPP
ncbi:hypothetical protein RE428_36500 [Marinobacter nanhaiticus D15-8W]|nr:hypothetical protein RE428_36500 [Marinobacter nanhaiticus D15-8W]